MQFAKNLHFTLHLIMLAIVPRNAIFKKNIDTISTVYIV